ncbi:VOC family protein [Altererythrobacter sp. Z27]|uniref:VOC family protein n=1 Tax=Altererythrobacter sp. Z27 TaxID=3461147 RepID=UPI004043AE36
MANQKLQLGWGHININVSDLDRSIAFYRCLGFEVFIPGIPYLGLDMSPRPSALSANAARALGIAQGTRGRACIMQLNDGFPKIDLMELENTSQDVPAQNADLGLVRLCLATNDLASDFAALKAQEVEFISDPQSAHDGMAEIAVCKDPDGTLIELLQVHLDRWQSLLSPS